MKIHEYQGKRNILRQFGVPVPRDYPRSRSRRRWKPPETRRPVWVVRRRSTPAAAARGGGKARALAGRRQTLASDRSWACSWSRTRPGPKEGARLYIEDRADIEWQAYYVRW